MGKDIKEGLQELHHFDCDNYGLDIVEEPEEDDLSWLGGPERKTEAA
jgi:hypothetical protein